MNGKRKRREKSLSDLFFFFFFFLVIRVLGRERKRRAWPVLKHSF